MNEISQQLIQPLPSVKITMCTCRDCAGICFTVFQSKSSSGY